MGQDHIECVMERIFRDSGFVVIHDGQKRPPNDGSRQFTSPPDGIRFFTRTLRKMVNGKFVDEWAIFKYDLRDMFCVDVQVTKKEPDGKKKRQVLEQKRWGRNNEIEAGGRRS